MDYVSINQLDLQFTAGEMRTLEQEIQIEDDNLVEGDESFFVVVSSANARVMIAGSPATVTIEDNDGILIATESYKSLFHETFYVIFLQ